MESLAATLDGQQVTILEVTVDGQEIMITYLDNLQRINSKRKYFGIDSIEDVTTIAQAV